MLRDPLRPKWLTEYLGQEKIKDLLKTSIQASKERKEPLDHVLLNGPPGLGKTTLANIIANEMGWKIKPIIGSTLTGAYDTESFIIRIKPKTVLFIDEVHRMRKPIQEIFYPVLEDGKLGGGEGTELAVMTVIGATTKMGMLDQPFVDRFPLQFQLEYYQPDELEQIIQTNSAKLRVQLDDQAREVIAERARGTPRIANNFLRRIRDYAQVGKIGLVDHDFALGILWGKMKVDDLGLDPIDRQYLKVLERSDGIGSDSIATQINQGVDLVEDFIEPYLLSLRFIERRRNGRWITELGKGWIGDSNAKISG